MAQIRASGRFWVFDYLSDKMKRCLLLTLVCCALAELAGAQVKPIQIDTLERVQQRERRPVMVLVGTSWCKYCLLMKHTLLRPSTMSVLARKNFHTVFLDAETDSEIRFAGRKYMFRPTGVNTGVHTLAEELAAVDGQIVYPTLCILNERLEVIYRHQGFLDTVGWTSLLKRLSSP